MKLTKDQETKLTEMAFAEKSNKEIAQELEVKLTDVHAARSKLGITIPKIKEMKARGLQPSGRTKDEIVNEISKVEKAKDAAEKKIDRCMARLEVLYEELVDAHDDNN